jgi:hypothetical protein
MGKLFMDSCLIQANASNNSVVNTESLKRHLSKGYQRLQTRLDEACEQQPEHAGAANGTHISTTDTDASVVRRGGGTSSQKYQVHRAVLRPCRKSACENPQAVFQRHWNGGAFVRAGHLGHD